MEVLSQLQLAASTLCVVCGIQLDSNHICEFFRKFLIYHVFYN